MKRKRTDSEIASIFFKSLRAVDDGGVDLVRLATNTQRPELLITDVLYPKNSFSTQKDLRAGDVPFAVVLDVQTETRRYKFLYHKINRLYPVLTSYTRLPRVPWSANTTIIGHDARTVVNRVMRKDDSLASMSTALFSSTVWTGKLFKPGRVFPYQTQRVHVSQENAVFPTPAGRWSVALRYDPVVMGGYTVLFSFQEESDLSLPLPGSPA